MTKLIDDLEENIKNVEKAILDKEDYLKLAHTRLDVRSQRSVSEGSRSLSDRGRPTVLPITSPVENGEDSPIAERRCHIARSLATGVLHPGGCTSGQK